MFFVFEPDVLCYGASTLGRILSECFPNTNVVYIFETVRMLSELDCYTECFPFASRMISVCFQNRPNTSRMFTSTGFLPERIPYDFRMLSEYGELKKYIYRNYVQRYCSFCCASPLRCQDTQWQNLPYYFADITGIRKGFGKGSLCSRAIWGVRKEYGTYWKCTSSSENIRKAYWNTERILETFGKHSSCSRSIRCVRKAYIFQYLLIFIPNAPRIKRMLPERFPYMPDAHRMLSERIFKHD